MYYIAPTIAITVYNIYIYIGPLLGRSSRGTPMRPWQLGGRAWKLLAPRGVLDLHGFEMLLEYIMNRLICICDIYIYKYV